MIRISLFFLFLLIFIPGTINGLADIENKNISGKSVSNEVVLSLQFGENKYSHFHGIIPTLLSGSIVIGDLTFEIENARAKIMGDSFVVHSDNILIYAKKIDLENYLINCYVIGGNKLEPIKLISVQQPNIPKEIENTKDVKLVVLVQQDIRTFWNDTYDLAVKVFDKSINPKPQFYQSLGAIDQAKVTVVIKNSDGIELKRFEGKTNSKGFWDESYFVAQNIVPGGNYVVELSVDYLGSKNVQEFETFIVSTPREGKD